MRNGRINMPFLITRQLNSLLFCGIKLRSALVLCLVLAVWLEQSAANKAISPTNLLESLGMTANPTVGATLGVFGEGGPPLHQLGVLKQR